MLVAHRQDQHGTFRGPQWGKTTPTQDPRLYRVSLSRVDGSVGCPLEGCRGRVKTLTNLWIHFMHLHEKDTIVILEEGNHHHPHPYYPF